MESPLVEPLVAHLLAEMPERRAWEREFPRGDPAARRLLLRALMNVRGGSCCGRS